jgi:FkbM family methyltransferase
VTTAQRPITNVPAELMRRMTSPLLGRGLGRNLPFVRAAYNFLVARLVRGIAVRRVHGHTMYLDLDDRGVGLPLYLNGAYEPGETALFQRIVQPGMVVFDVGAHGGYYTLIAARAVGAAGQVVAFEPDPANRALLLRNVAANGYRNVTVVPAAVSDRRGAARLYAGWGNAGDHRVYDTGDGRRWTDVASVTLDGFLDEGGVTRVDVIKMDIQGAEGAALRGMSALMRRHRQLKLLIEFWPLGLREAGESPEALLDGLVADGFRVHVVGPDGRADGTDRDAVMRRCERDEYVNLFLERSA